MANTAELVETICKMIGTSPIPLPITFANHGVEEVAGVIDAVVERCGRDGIGLTRVIIDPKLAEELGLIEGLVLPHGSRPTIHCELGLGRQVRFQRG